MKTNEQALWENHCAFLASHRGSLRREGSALYLESDRPEFSYAMLGSGSRLESLPAGLQVVQHFPWCELNADDFQSAGFASAMGLSYMVLGESLPEWRVRADLVIERVQSAARMDVFSELQNRGFNETPASFERWQPWLRAANQRNTGNPGQFFYIGSSGNEPLGVALTVIDGATAGIYAVTTLPRHRRKGISAAIMKRAISDARTNGCATFTLQVKQDSDAEKFYRQLGFARVFTTRFYRRNE